ncbi:winged helix DNA-binding domain-containing protein [Rhodococcus sp. NPDC058514]|uniref:winged helix DNA-binding domain-containing protein n=1 Tax=unclassified Rhodococcus (in: high G+C Gram-positive bacteria) TaxID=192944 RepID=UPI0036548671
MDRAQVLPRRMRNQHLWGAPLRTAPEVLGALVAVQAQEFAYAKWALAQRTRTVVEADIAAAYAQGSILRTHLLRPTWHFVTPEDASWLLDLTAPRVHAVNGYYLRKLELDDATLAKTGELIAAAVDGGNHLTRRQIGAMLHAAGVEADGLRLGYILMCAELDRVVISGVPKGRQHTYAAFGERVQASDPLGRDAALAQLARRYLASRGPATVRDLARWSGLTVADCRSGIDAVADEFRVDEVEGLALWYPPRKDTPPRPPVVDLVQGYDECIMSYTETKGYLVEPDLAERGEPRYMHAVLVDGRVVGRWKHTLSARSATIDMELGRALTARETAALDAELRRYGEFLELRIERP